MKHLLMASALALVTAGCAPQAVQRDLPPQFQSNSQLAFYKKLQARASASDSSGFQFAAVGEDRSAADRGPVGSNGTLDNVSTRNGSDTASGGTWGSETPQTNSAAGNQNDSSPQTPTQGDSDMGDTTPGDGGTETAPGDGGTGTAPGDGGTGTTPGDGGTGTTPGDGGTGTTPGDSGTGTTPGGGGGRTNPSCGNSGGNSANCR
jgi:hypothetical protein